MQSVHDAVRLLANDRHVATQVRDLKPPHDNLQINVAGAYRTVVEAQTEISRMKTANARLLFGGELQGLTGSGTKLPIIIGMFNNQQLLIDGIHRINDAANAGKEYVPCFQLTAKQTEAITEPRRQ